MIILITATVFFSIETNERFNESTNLEDSYIIVIRKLLDKKEIILVK